MKYLSKTRSCDQCYATEVGAIIPPMTHMREDYLSLVGGEHASRLPLATPTEPTLLLRLHEADEKSLVMSQWAIAAP
jgi:hypothetical protein